MFKPDWDVCAATEASLIEHMELVHHLKITNNRLLEALQQCKGLMEYHGPTPDGLKEYVYLNVKKAIENAQNAPL